MKKFILLLALLVVGLYLGRAPILSAAGNYLVLAQSPAPAEVAIVLGGDMSGARALTACRLLREGYVKKIWTSGELRFYQHSESELSRDFIIANGCPADSVVALHFDVDSTQDEARLISQEMRKLGIRKYLLLTSNFHTRRAGKLFREFGSGLEGIVVQSDVRDFEPDSWWKSRKSQKVFFFESIKTVTSWLGL